MVLSPHISLTVVYRCTCGDRCTVVCLRSSTFGQRIRLDCDVLFVYHLVKRIFHPPPLFFCPFFLLWKLRTTGVDCVLYISLQGEEMKEREREREYWGRVVTDTWRKLLYLWGKKEGTERTDATQALSFSHCFPGRGAESRGVNSEIVDAWWSESCHLNRKRLPFSAAGLISIVWCTWVCFCFSPAWLYADTRVRETQLHLSTQRSVDEQLNAPPSVCLYICSRWDDSVAFLFSFFLFSFFA